MNFLKLWFSISRLLPLFCSKKCNGSDKCLLRPLALILLGTSTGFIYKQRILSGLFFGFEKLLALNIVKGYLVLVL
jgi:hypothetical protein